MTSGNLGSIMKAMMDPVYAADTMIENAQYVPGIEKYFIFHTL